MEIEVDDYIRTKNGKIRKVKSTVAQYYITDRLNISDNNQFVKEDIVKHSRNIIDLIEVGDIVNGERILDITGDYIHTNETNHNKFYLAKHIKTILTKEQYQANCYTVERKEEC